MYSGAKFTTNDTDANVIITSAGFATSESVYIVSPGRFLGPSSRCSGKLCNAASQIKLLV